MPLRHKKREGGLRILLTNGRFPVSLDLSRQLRAAGHTVMVIDPMHFHVCKFSKTTKKSVQVPVPREDSVGFLSAVKKVINEERIQMVIPMHEEIFFLAQDPEIAEILFAPTFDQLMTLHNKWEFSEKMKSIGLDVPEAYLCKSVEDVKKLDRSRDWALKPTFGRATSGLHHLKANEELPEDLDVNGDNEHIAQVWMTGKMYCTYSVVRNGEVKSTAIYPVIDTIDGSSCVYFQSIDHHGIKSYIERIASAMHLTGQLAFDFIEAEGRLISIECNPRSTSGIHLFSKVDFLAEAFTNPSAPRRDAPIDVKRQLAPGMLMYKPQTGVKPWLSHMKRLMTSRDVLFSIRDPSPSLMQPFLLTSYYRLCHEKKLELSKLFQFDLVWEPKREEIDKRREMSIERFHVRDI
ncbi:hypothetical protein PROFUN_02070 [Planoprotostelium fungivorum]|uniref:ATP-grasp domain-containing protein n=1 Tax=Planoprotostelium fungivorum TaxID=1890364 RepID=A0A2P6NBB1_9EUKA|nr:hypothetical protein PROFUN_02070 [Planoprotostelium fungivorum]